MVKGGKGMLQNVETIISHLDCNGKKNKSYNLSFDQKRQNCLFKITSFFWQHWQTYSNKINELKRSLLGLFIWLLMISWYRWIVNELNAKQVITANSWAFFIMMDVFGNKGTTQLWRKKKLDLIGKRAFVANEG